jgi:hypothetical protein
MYPSSARAGRVPRSQKVRLGQLAAVNWQQPRGLAVERIPVQAGHRPGSRLRTAIGPRAFLSDDAALGH